MAVTPPAQVGHLVDAMKERDLELKALTARITATETAPEALSLEVRRLEAESRKLLADLRRAAQLEPDKARELLVRLFDGKLTARPVETAVGTRFELAGTASLKRMTTFDALLGGEQKPPQISASPAGEGTLMTLPFAREIGELWPEVNLVLIA
jgi:hypothetical protein